MSISIALTKGRLEEEAVKLLEKANYDALEFIKKGNLDKNKVLKLELSRCMDLSDV